MSQAQPTHAVLMGDLVGSEEAASPRRLQAIFNDAVAEANTRHKAAIASPLVITLGDEFQGLTRSLQAGFAVLRDLRFTLLEQGVSCRFVLGEAHLESALNPKRAWNMMGRGLSAARDKLNDKRSPNCYRFSFPDDPLVESLMDAIGLSLTDIEAHWTDTQRQYMQRLWRGGATQAEMARELGIALRTLQKVWTSARRELYAAQADTVRDALIELDKRMGR